MKHYIYIYIYIYIHEALSYMHVTMETGIMGVAIIYR